MELGIFARTFVGHPWPEILQAVRKHRLNTIQLNLASAGLPTLPETFEPARAKEILSSLRNAKITVAAVSGTFNMAHPEADRRRAGLRGLQTVLQYARALEINIVTLCTGSRHAGDMWKHHADNESPAAWSDMLEVMEKAAATAEAMNVTVAFEPELGNVVNSVEKALRLFNEIKSPHLRMVLDAANLIPPRAVQQQRELLDNACALLGDRIVSVHAKDLRTDGTTGDVPAGTGCLDFDHYFAALRKIGYDGAVILHGIRESDVESSVRFLRDKLQAAAPQAMD